MIPRPAHRLLHSTALRQPPSLRCFRLIHHPGVDLFVSLLHGDEPSPQGVEGDAV